MSQGLFSQLGRAPQSDVRIRRFLQKLRETQFEVDGETLVTSGGVVSVNVQNPLTTDANGVDLALATDADNLLSVEATGLLARLPGVAKGDIFVYNGSDLVRLPVGTDGQIIYADPGEATGLRWGDPPSGFEPGQLAGQSDTVTGASGNLTIARGLAGTSATVTGASGALNPGPTFLSGTSLTTTGASGTLNPGPTLLSGTSATTTDASADLTVSGGGTGWNLATLSYTGDSFEVAGQEENPRGVSLSSDGTKMYVSGGQNNEVHQYTLSTAWDISTASYDSVSVAGQGSFTAGVTFKPDGTKMYVTGLSPDSLHQYTLSTAWDISTASYDSVSFGLAEDATPIGVAFKPDGTKMYMAGIAGGDIYQYTLSTAWDISSASYDSVSFDPSPEEGSPTGVAFESGGTTMWVVGEESSTVYQYTLSTPWNVSTASYDSVSLNSSSEAGNMGGIFVRPGGTDLFLISYAADAVYQYST